MKTARQVRNILERNKKDLALLIGNGVNLHKMPAHFLDWGALLEKLWKTVRPDLSGSCPKGVSNTEFYDLLGLETSHSDNYINLQVEVQKLLFSWDNQPHHRQIIAKAQEFKAPVLTTNFEYTLHTPEVVKRHIQAKGFTDFYPWSTYYAEQELEQPNDGFGIWHVNGSITYARSIRLGLTHYMGSVQRARHILNDAAKKRKSDNSNDDRIISNTWLDIIFGRSLFIFGIGLYENEVFLRWLLIERARFYRSNPEYKKKGWYIAKKGESNKLLEGRKFFLKSLGIEYVEVENFDVINEEIWQ